MPVAGDNFIRAFSCLPPLALVESLGVPVGLCDYCKQYTSVRLKPNGPYFSSPWNRDMYAVDTAVDAGVVFEGGIPTLLRYWGTNPANPLYPQAVVFSGRPGILGDEWAYPGGYSPIPPASVRLHYQAINESGLAVELYVAGVYVRGGLYLSVIDSFTLPAGTSPIYSVDLSIPDNAYPDPELVAFVVFLGAYDPIETANCRLYGWMSTNDGYDGIEGFYRR